MKTLVLFCAFCAFLRPSSGRADTVALWLFDEQVGVYPSSVLNDAGPGSHFLILGRGAEIVPGKFGNALQPVPPAPLAATVNGAGADADSSGGSVTFGLRAPPVKAGRTQPPLTWANAHFAAMFTNGDAHLRRAPFANATDSKLNLGGADWTIECWLRISPEAKSEGVIFEVGAGPRGENDLVTRFSVLPGENAFAFTFLSTPDSAVAKRVEFPDPVGPPGGSANVQTTTLALNQGVLPRDRWLHVAVIHTAAAGELRLFIDGKVRAVAAAKPMALPHGDEAYVSIGRDGRWGRPLGGAIDELRISDHGVYPAEFAVPASFSRRHNGTRTAPPPLAGLPLLFSPSATPAPVLDLGSRRHLFLDAALLAVHDKLTFTVHPAHVAEAASLPFWAGSAVNVFYDDQRQRYLIHNRTDYYRTPAGSTDRKSLLTEVTDLLALWPFQRVTAEMTQAATARGVLTHAGQLDPWRLDNGPLAPGGFGLEYPIAFQADAAGYAQLGFIDERGAPVPGFSVDECVYVNGDEIAYEVEWLGKDDQRTKDVSALAGKPVQLVARLRGASL